MSAAEISQCLTRLAVVRHVSASTQNQALAGLLFLYKGVLNVEIGNVPPVVRARTPDRLPRCSVSVSPIAAGNIVTRSFWPFPRRTLIC
jgi:hypothetical protein